MAVTFPTGGGDACLHTAADIAAPTALTLYFWYRGVFSNSAGQFRNFCSLGSGPSFDFYFDDTPDRIILDRDFSGTNGSWTMAAANYGVTPSTTSWNWLAVTQDGTTGVAVWYHSNGSSAGPVSRTNTTGATPSGTIVTGGTHALHIGNWSGHDAAHTGDIAWFGYHNVVLTAQELAEAMWRGMAFRGLVRAYPLFGVSDSPDLSGNAASLSANGTPTTTAVGPPVMPVWINPIPWLPMAEAEEEPPAATTGRKRRTLVGVGR